jgi:hypothetical protein
MKLTALHAHADEKGETNVFIEARDIMCLLFSRSSALLQQALVGEVLGIGTDHHRLLFRRQSSNEIVKLLEAHLGRETW